MDGREVRIIIEIVYFTVSIILIISYIVGLWFSPRLRYGYENDEAFYMFVIIILWPLFAVGAIISLPFVLLYLLLGKMVKYRNKGPQ